MLTKNFCLQKKYFSQHLVNIVFWINGNNTDTYNLSDVIGNYHLTLYRRTSLTGDIRNNPIHMKNLSNRELVRRAPERTHIASLMLTLCLRISLTGTSEAILFIWKIGAIANENYLSLDHNSGGRGLINTVNEFFSCISFGLRTD